MKRSEILTELKKYFSVADLVCPDVQQKFGDRAWQFFSTIFLHTLLVVRRDIIKSPMICNNYTQPTGTLKQRGLRCNLCQIVKDKTKAGQIYLSAHTTGEAGDFDVVNMTAVQSRHLIMDNVAMLPYPIRLEDGVTWLHLDTYDSGSNEPLTLFKV